MPLHLTIPQDSRIIELEEYVNILEENKYNLMIQEDIIESAVYLNQLNNNKKFLLNHICNELKDSKYFQKSNFYGPQVFVIYTTKKYFLRAVIWNPITKAQLAIKDFKYDICHDHNFDILTAGYFGPGYESRCYTYKYDEVLGLLGENVNMINENTFTLSEGKIALYRSKHDIHIQLPPKSTSVSINLIPRSNIINQPQFQFDESTSQICKYIQLSGNELAIRFAGIIGDENYIDILESIMKRNTNSHVQATAAVSIIRILPSLTEYIENWIRSNNNPLIVDLFIKEKDNYGTCLKSYCK